MRDIAKLIDEMLEIIPEKEEYLIRKLKSTQGSASYTAPEYMVTRFVDVQRALETHIPCLSEDWEYKVVSLFTQIPENELRQ